MMVEAWGIPADVPKMLRITRHGFFRADLWSDAVNGGRNETGIRRFRRLLALAESRGWAIEWTRNGCRNSYETLDEFMAAIS